MSLFHSYVVRDVLEVEPVYFQGRVAASSPSAAEEDGGEQLDTQPYPVSFEDTLMHRLTERYVGKIVPGCGLCVAVHEILQYTQGVVRGPSASAWLTAQFRLCVFAPTPGARLRATISAQTREGIFLTLDFFQFVFFVPGDLLVAPSSYHEEKRCWVLHVEGDDEDEAEAEALEPALNPYENGDEVIVKVECVIVRDLVDFHGNVGAKGNNNNNNNGAGGASAGKEATSASQLPMEVRGSFVGTGLGPVLWFEK